MFSTASPITTATNGTSAAPAVQVIEQNNPPDNGIWNCTKQ